MSHSPCHPFKRFHLTHCFHLAHPAAGGEHPSRKKPGKEDTNYQKRPLVAPLSLSLIWPMMIDKHVGQSSFIFLLLQLVRQSPDILPHLPARTYYFVSAPSPLLCSPVNHN